MITTGRDDFAKGIEMLRCMNLIPYDPKQTRWEWGSLSIEKKQDNDYWIPAHFNIDDWNGHWGNNYRMNEIQAAVGCAQLDKLDMLNEKRRTIEKDHGRHSRPEGNHAVVGTRAGIQACIPFIHAVRRRKGARRVSGRIPTGPVQPGGDPAFCTTSPPTTSPDCRNWATPGTSARTRSNFSTSGN